MDRLSPKQVREKRKQAHDLAVSVHVGKAGIMGAAQELDGQLKTRKLVKVRLLPAATQGGQDDAAQAAALAEATNSVLVEVRGHTAVYWRR